MRRLIFKDAPAGYGLPMKRPLEPTSIEIVSTRQPTAIEHALGAAGSQSPAAMYLARLAKGSRRTQAGALNWIARALGGESAGDFPWWQMTYPASLAVRAKLEEAFAFTTANRHLAALRGVLKETWRLGLMNAEAYQRAVDVQSIKGSRLPAGRELAKKEMAALFRVCREDETSLGRRDAAMLVLLRFGGLRRHEAVGALLRDYGKSVGSLRLVGKGNKERVVFLGKRGTEIIGEWLAVRPQGGETLLTHEGQSHSLTSQAVFDTLRKRASEAGLGDSFSAHDFRRTFASNLFAEGVDLSTAQQIMGHSNASTTQRYDRRDDAAKRMAADKLGGEE